MKIVMLGHSGVGKTSYMVSMYGRLLEPIQGFSVRCRRKSDHRDLKGLYRELGSGHYPAATDQRSSYKLTLRFKGKGILPFTWVDYRGDSLRQRKDRDDAKRLIQDLRSADGLLAFFDCDALARGGPNPGIGRMVYLLTRAFEELDNPVPFALVCTKADLVETLSDHHLRPIEGLIDVVRASDRIIGTLVPVACGAQPYQVEMPVLFLLHYGLLTSGHRGLGEMEASASRAREYRDRSGIIDDFFAWLGGEPTYRELADREEVAIEASSREAKSLMKSARRLGGVIEGLPVF